MPGPALLRCNTWPPTAVGGRWVSWPPRGRVGPRTPQTVSSVSQSCPKCGDRGLPSPATAPGWVCPAGTGVARVGMPHPCIPRRCGVPCHCWKPVPVGWWVSFKLFQTAKIYIYMYVITKHGALGLRVVRRGWGVTLGRGDGMCPSPRVVELLVDVGAVDRSVCWGGYGCLHVGLSPLGLV